MLVTINFFNTKSLIIIDISIIITLIIVIITSVLIIITTTVWNYFIIER